MGLGDLAKKIRLALALNGAFEALQKGWRMGKFKPVLVGVVGAAVAGVVSELAKVCPDLKAQILAIVLAGVAGAATTYMLKPKQYAGLKATVTGLGTIALGAAVAKLDAVCPGIIAQLPALAVAGVTAGLGLWLKSHREPN